MLLFSLCPVRVTTIVEKMKRSSAFINITAAGIAYAVKKLVF